MTVDAAVTWTRARSSVDWLLLAVGLTVFGYVGWDGALWDARFQLLLHLLAVGTILGVGCLGLRGHAMPRTPLDLPLLGLLAAFALATLSALNLGMSLRAIAGIFAFAAMLPAALLAVRHRPAWVGLVTSIPVLLLATATLVSMIFRRIEWIVVGAPGWPPLRLPSEFTPLGSVAVGPFVVIPAWVLAGLITHARLRGAVRTALLVVGIPLVILSGSRSAWLGIAAGFLVAVAPWAWRRRAASWPTRPSARGAVVAIGVLAAVTLGLALVLPRLTAVGSLLYRGALWRDTLTAWSSDPIFGIGPGFMPYARQAAAADYSFPVRQPHSHNLLLGVLGDAGLIGLGAGLILVGALCVAAAPWRSRAPLGRASSLVLVGLGIASLFEDLTFLPSFNLLAIALVAVALLDGDTVGWAPIALGSARRRWVVLTATGASAAILVAAMVVADAGAIAYRAGIDNADAGNWRASTTWLERAVRIDQWHPAGPRALAVAANENGNQALALEAAAQATLLNPGDATAWANRALLCLDAGDEECARVAARGAIVTARYQAAELLYAAVVLDRLGDRDTADAAYRRSLITQPATSSLVDWPRRVAIGDGVIPDITDASWQLNLLVARHASGEPVVPSEFADPAVRALAHAVRGERELAMTLLALALEEHPDDSRTFEIAIILRDSWGEPIDDMLRIASIVRGKAFPDRELGADAPGTVYDIGSFRGYPHGGLVSSSVVLDTTPPYPWTLEEVLP